MIFERIGFFIYRTLRLGVLGRKMSSSHLACFGYHDVGEDGALRVSVEALRAQIMMIQKLGYVFVTLHDVDCAIRGEYVLPKKSALLYFDDGRAGVLSAKKVFKDCNVRPIFFITPTVLDMDGFLKTNQVREIDFGDIGVHGLTHDRYARMGADMVTRDMHEAQEQLSRIMGGEIYAWSYPHSDPDALAPESAWRAGYRVVIGDGRGVNTYPVSGFLKKIPMSSRDTRLSISAKLGGWYAVWNALLRMRRSFMSYPKTASTRVWRVGGVFRRVRVVHDDAAFLVARRRGGWTSLVLISFSKLFSYPYMRVREKRTLVVDVMKDDDALLASFSDTCRNEIRRTFRDDALRFEQGVQDMRAVMRLYRAFRKAKKLPVHGTSYFEGSLMFRAYLNGKLVSVVTAYEGKCARVQHIFSASVTDKETKNRIAYASRRLLYECMKYARDHESSSVDLAGINVTRSEKAGITAFKRSFGGEEVPEYTYTVTRPWAAKLKRMGGKLSVF